MECVARNQPGNPWKYRPSSATGLREDFVTIEQISEQIQRALPYVCSLRK